MKQLLTESKLARPANSKLLAFAIAQDSNSVLEIEELEHSEDNVYHKITTKFYPILWVQWVQEEQRVPKKQRR